MKRSHNMVSGYEPKIIVKAYHSARKEGPGCPTSKLLAPRP